MFKARGAGLLPACALPAAVVFKARGAGLLPACARKEDLPEALSFQCLGMAETRLLARCGQASTPRLAHCGQVGTRFDLQIIAVRSGHDPQNRGQVGFLTVNS